MCSELTSFGAHAFLTGSTMRYCSSTLAFTIIGAENETVSITVVAPAEKPHGSGGIRRNNLSRHSKRKMWDLPLSVCVCHFDGKPS
jgi:hypothetical protein